MPPAVIRAFGFEGTMNDEHVALDKYGDFRYKGGDQQLEDGKAGKKYSGLGRECGVVPDPESAGNVDAGRLLVRGQWNSELFGPLGKMYEEGRTLERREDVWVHKNRMSGLWGTGSELEGYLEREGIKTLLFTGVSLSLSYRTYEMLISMTAGQHGPMRRRNISRRFQQRLRLHPPERRLRHDVAKLLPAMRAVQRSKHVGLLSIVQRSRRCCRAHGTIRWLLLGLAGMYAKPSHEVRLRWLHNVNLTCIGHFETIGTC